MLKLISLNFETIFKNPKNMKASIKTRPESLEFKFERFLFFLGFGKIL